MFENIEQLEKEVEEFRNNILASTEFAKKLEGIIAGISEQEQSFAVKTTELTRKLDSNADALSTSQAEALKKLIEENQAMVKRLADTSSQFESIIKLQMDAVKADHQELVKQLEDENKAISSGFDRLVANLNEANQEHLTKTADSIRSTQKEYLSAIEKAVASIDACKDDLREKYDEFLKKLESTNVDQMIKLCQEMKQSMNTRLLVVLSGVGVSIVLMIINLLIK